MKHWNSFFDVVQNVRRCYLANGGDIHKPFEDWLESLNNDFFNTVFEPVEINQHNELVLFRYGIDAMKPGFWTEEHSIYRDCRSIVVDVLSGELALSPFKKFFNINELEETSIENIQNKLQTAKTIEFSNKLDGSMQSFRYYNGEIIGAGSRSVDLEKSFRLKAGYEHLSLAYKKMLVDHPNHTFVFELIDPIDVHVVDYRNKQSGLYLIGIVDMVDGRELSFLEMLSIANQYDGILTTTLEPIDLLTALSQAEVLKSNIKEGWVLNIDGYKVKIKCSDYVQIHKALAKVVSANFIIEAVDNRTIDDLYSKVPQAHKHKIDAIVNDVILYVDKMEYEVNRNFLNLSSKFKTKKDFMIAANNLPSDVKGYIVSKYLGKTFSVLKQGGKYKKMHQIKSFLNGEV